MISILLAAGLSTRMGRQKLLLPFAGSTVVETVIDNLNKAGLSPVYAVFSEGVERAVSARPSWLRVTVNPKPEDGQAGSLDIGLSMLPKGKDFCIMLGDQPLASPREMAELAEKFNSLPEDKSVLVPCLGKRLGHPMFYRAKWRERFINGYKGDKGNKRTLFTYESEISAVEGTESLFFDIDTLEDYEKLKKEKQ